MISGEIVSHAWALLLDAAPWLVLGLAAAGLAHAWLPTDVLGRWLGGRGLRPAVLAALVGAPLPLCSCAVLPAAVSLRRGGASREAVAAFLIATPETGLDSVALTYGLLGPFFAVARPLAAVTSAVATGLAMTLLKAEPALAPAASAASGCANACCGDRPPTAKHPPALRRTLEGLAFAFSTLFNELAPWLAIGLLVAAVAATVVPPQAFGYWSTGLPAMLAMIALGIPLYICATASTPLAVALLLAGVAPGAVMVFLLVGPATNIATIAVVRSELGAAATVIYLAGLIGCSVVAGILTDVAAPLFFDPTILRPASGGETGANGLDYLAAILVLGLGARAVWMRVQRLFAAERVTAPRHPRS